MQQPEYVDTTSEEVIGVSEPLPLANLPSAAQSDQQWRRIGAQVSVFLAQLPDALGRFFNEYKQPIISLALIVSALIAVKVFLAVLGTLNDLPLLASTFKFVGIGYSVWFVNRYLIKASKRQELAQEIQTLKEQVIGSQKIPESQS